MAKTTNHVATHDGFTFTRGSKTRHYSHVVIQRESIAADRIRCADNARATWKMNLKWHQEHAAGVNKLALKYPEQYTPERIAKEQAESQAMLAAGVEGLIAEALKRFDAYSADVQVAADGDTFYSVIGWTSRLDLAHNQAKGSPARIILPVTVV